RAGGGTAGDSGRRGGAPPHQGRATGAARHSHAPLHRAPAERVRAGAGRDRAALMRILASISHVYNPGGDRQYASAGADPMPRVAALTACLRGLRENVAGPSLYSDMEHSRVAAYPRSEPVELDIVV